MEHMFYWCSEPIKDNDNKALDCKDAIDELKETEAELYETAFQNVVTEYEGRLAEIEFQKNLLDEYVSQTEAKGYIVSTKYYDALIENEKANIKKLEEEKNELLVKMDEAVSSGTIEKGSESWQEMVNQINDVTLAIEESNTAIIEFNNSIRDIEWSIFDLLQEKISYITSEADFLVELMSNDNLYDDRGQFNEYGMSTMGLHGVNYNVYMAQADKYAEEMQKINKEIANDPYNQDLIERRQELLELQQDMILAAENEKQSIKDLVSEGIELELDALQELIDKYEDALDSQKSLYDFQKKISEQTKDIASLQKQLAAYQGDNSEEAKAKIQELKVSLEESKNDLEETQYDQFVSDQKKLLDELYTDYESILNARLDNIDALISDMITEINENASMISTTLSETAESVGYTLSESMTTIWNTNTESITNVVAIYGQDIENGILSMSTTVNAALSAINTNIQFMIAAVNNLAAAKIEAASIASASNTPQASGTNTSSETSASDKTKIDTSSTSNESDNSSNDANFFYDKDNSYPKSKLNTNVSIVDRLKYNDYDSSFEARSDYYEAMGFTGTYTGSATQNSQMVQWMKANGYASGVRKVDKDQMAWTQENGQEYIIRPSDGAILTPIAKDDSVLKPQASNNIWEFANNPSDFIRDNLRLDNIVTPSAQCTQNTYQQNLDKVIFNLPNVKNYEELLSEMQSDKNFERLILSMTIDRIAGKSVLAKGKAIH